LRTDASLRFRGYNKWGVCPSLSAGWTSSNESFYEDALGCAPSMKLRARWGRSGNTNVTDYPTITSYSNPTRVIIDDRGEAAYYPRDIKDTGLGWEIGSQYNAGLDLTMWNRRLSLMTNFYLSQSTNLLFNQPISAVSGATTILTNLPHSKVENKGFDLQLDARLVRNENWDLGFSGNINVNRNKVLDLGGASTIITNGAERSYQDRKS